MKFWLLIQMVVVHNRSTFGNDRTILRGGFGAVKSVRGRGKCQPYQVQFFAYNSKTRRNFENLIAFASRKIERSTNLYFEGVSKKWPESGQKWEKLIFLRLKPEKNILSRSPKKFRSFNRNVNYSNR